MVPHIHAALAFSSVFNLQPKLPCQASCQQPLPAFPWPQFVLVTALVSLLGVGTASSSSLSA